MSKIKQENIELKEHIEYLETQLEKKQLEFKPVFKCSLKLIVEDRVQVISTDKYIVDGDTAQFTFEIPNGYFGDQSKQIADLEAKLADLQAEQIEEMKEHQEAMKLANNVIKDLEAKLAEREKELNKWSTEYARAYVNRQNDLIAENQQLKQQLADAEEHIDALELQLREQYELVDEKDEQLAEKEKEIERLQHCNDRLAQGIYHSYGEHFILKVKQDKISFAVEQLEKVKNRIQEDFDYDDLMYWLNKQIKAIKGDEVV